VTHPRILIFIPTYNESRNVERLCAELRAIDVPADVLFLDDGSPDGTGVTLDRLARDDPRMAVVHRGQKLGIGSAHRAGILYAYDHGYDLLVTLDADFSHTPADIPRLLAAHGPGVDLVVGSRYLQPGSLPGWSPHRRFLTQLGHVMTRTLLGLPYDASGAFRLYDLRRIPPALFDLVRADAYSFFFESLFVLQRNGCRVSEVPIVLPARVYGSSKLTWREALRSGRFMLALYAADLTHPERFRLGRPIDRLRDDLKPAGGWDDYWSDKTHAVGHLYDIVAALYRRLMIQSRLRRRLARHFSAGAHLLHAGCGSGQMDRDLHRCWRVTAVDISREALERYARNNREAHHIEQADIMTLPFDAGIFDGVFNLGVLEHFSGAEIEAVLGEFHRTLKPGGKIVLFWPHRRGSSVLVLNAAHRLLRLFGRPDVRLHPPEVSLIRSRRTVEAVLERAGFRIVDYEFGMRDLFVQCVIVASRSDDRRSPASVPRA
jgi:dolichol-phosphate mannosyltransferase